MCLIRLPYKAAYHRFRQRSVQEGHRPGPVLEAPERFGEDAPGNRRLRPSPELHQFDREDMQGLCLTAPKYIQRSERHVQFGALLA